METKVIAAVVIIIAIVAGVFLLLTQKPDYPDIENPVPVKGNLEAKVVVTEFSDFQCPACVSTEPYFEVIFDEFKDSIKLEYRQFPLPSHNYAFKASEASLCAQDFGKFWEYHDLLFAANGKLDDSSLIEMAKGVGIKEEQFRNCLYSGKKEQRVKEDIALGNSKGVTGTPSFFVNGEKIQGELLSEILKNLKAKIAEKIQEAS